MKEVRIDNLVTLSTLLMLQGKPQHGYEIIKTINERLGRDVSPGQIYPFLKKLKALGYVKMKQTGGREKKTYTLTARGRKFSRTMIEKFGVMVEMALADTLKKCMHCGCEVYKGGYRKGRLHFCCRNCAAAYRG